MLHVKNKKYRWSQLYAQHYSQVYTICLQLLKHKENSEDATMEVFEILFQYQAKHTVHNPSHWLLKVAKNHCLQKFRQQHYSATLEEEPLTEYNELLASMQAQKSLNYFIKSALKKLKPKQRYCIELFYFENLSYDKIAFQKGIDKNTVKTNLQNGKRNLKQLLIGHFKEINEYRNDLVS